MGLLHPTAGSVRFDGQEIAGRPPFEIARLGIGYVPEDRRIFKSLTVHENLQMGIKKSAASAPRGSSWTIERVYDIFPRLGERRANKGGHLSGGEQQMLTLARTLMGNPRLVLVDEPTEGLAPLIVKEVLEMLSTVRNSGVTVLMVEQNFKAAIKVADRFYIMSKGQVVFEGDVGALMAAEEVRKNYLEV
jgi:branched-chain amino acid transport system ATP-binding protein